MANGTAMGPHDFSIDFFHPCWNMLKEEVIALVEESRKKIWILLTLNAMHLALILKAIGASHPGKFRPISLYNVIYKIISKVVPIV